MNNSFLQSNIFDKLQIDRKFKRSGLKRTTLIFKKGVRQFSFLLLLLLAKYCVAQTDNALYNNQVPMSISWELITNKDTTSEPDEFHSKAILRLVWEGSESLPVKGWSIYFNYNRNCRENLRSKEGISKNGPLTLRHVNGDLYEIRPTIFFRGLLPNRSLLLDILSEGEVLNNSAVPNGFYWVWDKEPEMGLLLKQYRLLPMLDPEATSDSVIYEENKKITDISKDKLIKVLPTPVYYKENGNRFDLNQVIQFKYCKLFKKEAGYLKQQLEVLNSKRENRNKQNLVLFTEQKMSKEAYELNVKEHVIEIKASTGQGAFYAIQSLLSLIAPQNAGKYLKENYFVTGVKIIDSPRFSYRGLSLDIARNFIPKGEVLKIIDLLAFYKLNTLHLHFSDDEGWRIQMPSLPELTEVGGRRGQAYINGSMLPPSYGSGPDTTDNKTGMNLNRGNGFYGSDDFIEILRYAELRHIQIVPEIESPGHSRAAIRSMVYRYRKWMERGNVSEAERYLLSDFKDSSIYQSAQLWSDNVLCVALPSTYQFLARVIDDLIMLYKKANVPLSTIHMGGDEVPAGAWEKSPVCKALLTNNISLKRVHDLWLYYYNKVDSILKQRGLKMSGWEEMGMWQQGSDVNMKPNPTFVHRKIQLHVWNNLPGGGQEDLAYQLANLGYKVILSPVTNNYFDLAYYRHPDEPGAYWGGYSDVNKPFRLVPMDYFKVLGETTNNTNMQMSKKNSSGRYRLTEVGERNLIGLEGLIWSETIKSDESLEYMLLPKLLGMAQRAWVKDPDWSRLHNDSLANLLYQKDYNRFLNELGKWQLPKLDEGAGVNNVAYLYRIPTPGVKVIGAKIYLNCQIPGFIIRYTTDGTQPTNESRIYKEPIEMTNLRASVFNLAGRSGRVISIFKEKK